MTKRTQKLNRIAAPAALALALTAQRAAANPTGMTVGSGSVTAVQNGANLDLTASHNATITWSSFNIAPGETTTFHQPSAVSVVWNQILDRNPSQIWGSLNANGIVVLMNQNGFYFGPNSSINVGGFIATTAPLLPGPSGPGGFWQYSGPPPVASIINYGEIRARDGGSLFLVAEKIENHGILSAPDGTLGLYAGKQVLLSERPDGRGLAVNVELPQGAIDNYGKLIADAGTIALHAQVVNQNGLVQANSVCQRNGVIELIASDAVNLGANSVIRANGDSTGISGAGRITVKSAGSFTDDPASRLEVRGGALGGNGGSVEISTPVLSEIHSALDATAQSGFTGGRLLLDPYDLTLTSGSLAPFLGFSQITLQATHNITLATGATLDLNASTGVSAPCSLFTLQAGNDILFNNNSRIVAGPGWSVSLSAGVDFSSPGLSVRPGVGGIYLNGGTPSASGAKPNYNGAIECADGCLSLNAGHAVLVGSGYLRTVGGGNISITTGDGDVDAGTKNDTYDYTRFGYDITTRGLGGIGTANGGNVTIHSGRDILSLTATIGAFGDGAGNVDLTAARDIKGRFLVRNGIGSLHAGRDVGSTATPASFGLIGGGWNITGARDVYLNEVYNPNGSLNGNRMLFGARVPFQFDYAPDTFVDLVAGTSVQLLGNSPARTSSNPDRQPIYAPRLSIESGAGGVVLGNNVTLYPSPLGSLSIVTTAGGSLRSAPGRFAQLIVSDSDSPDYKTFANGHAVIPIHMGNTGAGVRLDIAGDVQNLFLRSPEAADFRIHGNAVNFSFEGQNLSVGDTTRLLVDGNYFSRSDRTAAALQDAPTLAAFDSIFNDPLLTADPALAARLSYDPVTHKLAIQGIMTPTDLSFLLHPVVFVLDPITGDVVRDANNNPITVPVTFTADAAALQQLYAATQDIPTSPLAHNGIQIGGPGALAMAAHNLDLGISSGIRSVGPLLNPNLAGISVQGANLRVNFSGNLDMTSSQIASFNGGSIDLEGAGAMNIGSQGSFTSDSTPKGIYTAHGGNVMVHAGGDVLVNGSRIASYDGGDVTVISDFGQVNAGDGAKGFFSVTTSQFNPATGQLENRNDRFFGSGIMALTRTTGDAEVGNITIQAGRDILAGAGGVIQLAFNNRHEVDADAAVREILKEIVDRGVFKNPFNDQSSFIQKVTLVSEHGSIRAAQSGVLGQNLDISAPKGGIEGIFAAAADANLHAQNSISGTVLAGGTANVSGQSVSGSVIGGGDVNVSGGEITASVISTGGAATGAGGGSAFAGVAAPAAQQTVAQADKTVAASSAQTGDDDEEKKQRAAKGPVLTRRVGRVTVILPKA